MHDLVVEDGRVVTPQGVRELHVGVTNGVIAELSASPLSGRARVSAAERIVLPGAVDLHVHFNDPGRAHWEGWATGTAAAILGGTTTVVDMPLNASPPTTDADSFRRKLDAARGEARSDFALWGGLVDDNVDRLAEQRASGAIGFKAFMCDTGVDDFRYTPRDALRRGMAEIADLGSFLAVHAEDADLVRERTRTLREAGRVDREAWLEAHAPDQELKAIHDALGLARATGCPLHVVHVSLPEGIDALRGVPNVTSETCVHYLTLTDEDFVRLGPAAKCAPPLRDAARREGLWARLLAGDIDFVTSDHSPSPLEAKTRGEHDVWAAWGGIQGVGLLLPLLLSEGVVKRGLSLDLLARIVAEAPARRAGLASKGRIEVGMDADLVVARLGDAWVVRDLPFRHFHSPYLGQEIHARIEHVLLRGEPAGPPRGRFLERI